MKLAARCGRIPENRDVSGTSDPGRLDIMKKRTVILSEIIVPSLALLLSGCVGYRIEPGAELGKECHARCSSTELRITSPRGTLSFKPNSSAARIDDVMNMVIPRPINYEGRCYILEKRLLETIIYPLLLRRPAGIATVMIDPGHGGSEPGAPGTIRREKELNLAVALKLRDELERRGFNVIMTRDRDTTVPLRQRVEIANASPADIFVSIHHDAAHNTAARGYSIFAPRDCSDFTAESTVLAAAIQGEIVKLPHVVDRGVRFANFRVLHSAMPSVLLELGFVSNRDEEKMINDPGRQGLEAAAIADGIANYRAGVRGAARP